MLLRLINCLFIIIIIIITDDYSYSSGSTLKGLRISERFAIFHMTIMAMLTYVCTYIRQTEAELVRRWMYDNFR